MLILHNTVKVYFLCPSCIAHLGANCNL